MASSSVSQESLDMEDYENMARRNRIRTHRGRAMPHRSGEREGGGDFHDRDGRGGDYQNGDTGDSALHAGGDHESPTRSAAARLKDKQRSRANHLHKGKPPKDKRKLREKRRSTGVVHLPSTEVRGKSLVVWFQPKDRLTVSCSPRQSSRVNCGSLHVDLYGSNQRCVFIQHNTAGRVHVGL